MKILSYECFQLDWRGIEIEVRYCSEYSSSMKRNCGYSFAHLEISSLCHSPLPITETGYVSRFEHPDNVDHFGGPVAFVEAWLDYNAKHAEWKNGELVRSQLSLF